MKWTEHTALGALVEFYRMTQRAGLVLEAPDRIVTVVVISFESDDEASRFLDAMLSAQLATRLADGKIHIRGNEKHVDRLTRLSSTASKAGTASAAMRQKKSNNFVTEGQPGANLQGTEIQPVGNAPYSLLLTPRSLDPKIPFSQTETSPLPHQPDMYHSDTHLDDMSHNATDVGSDNIHSDNQVHKTSKEPSKRKKLSTGVSPPVGMGVTVAIREAWKQHFEKRFPGQQAAWGKREGGQAKNLLGTFSQTELISLIEHFFAWARPEVIRAGYPFGTGSNSFVMKIHELRADIADADRRKVAAQVHEREKLRDKLAVDDDGVNRTNALLAQRDPFDDSHWLEESGTGVTTALAQGDSDASGSTREDHERRSAESLVLGSGEARDRESNLERISAILQATTNAVDSRRSSAYRKQSPRVPAVLTDAELDARGAQEIFERDEEMLF